MVGRRTRLVVLAYRRVCDWRFFPLDVFFVYDEVISLVDLLPEPVEDRQLEHVPVEGRREEEVLLQASFLREPNQIVRCFLKAFRIFFRFS